MRDEKEDIRDDIEVVRRVAQSHMSHWGKLNSPEHAYNHARYGGIDRTAAALARRLEAEFSRYPA